MLVAGVLPAVAFTLPMYSALWGPATGIRFTVLVLLVELIVMEKLMRDFRKIPFACSYLPGKANLKLMFAAYVIFFLMAAWAVTNLAVSMAGSTRGFIWGVGLSLAWMGWRLWRNRVERGWPGFVSVVNQPLVIGSQAPPFCTIKTTESPYGCGMH